MKMRLLLTHRGDGAVYPTDGRGIVTTSSLLRLAPNAGPRSKAFEELHAIAGAKFNRQIVYAVARSMRIS